MTGQPYGILNPTRILSPSQVAKRASVSIRTLQRYVREGSAPIPVKIGYGQRIGFYEGEVESWLSNLPRTREAA